MIKSLGDKANEVAITNKISQRYEYTLSSYHDSLPCKTTLINNKNYWQFIRLSPWLHS